MFEELVKQLGVPALVLAVAAVAYDRLQSVIKKVNDLSKQVALNSEEIAHIKGLLE